MKNVNYTGTLESSGWRKISMGSWRPTGDSSINVMETIRVESILQYIERAKRHGNASAGINSFFSLLFGRLLADHPEFNTVVRAGQRHQRKHVDTFFHIVQPNQNSDLSGMTIRAAETKSFFEISQELSKTVSEVREGRSDEFAKSKKIFAALPGFLAKWVLDFIGFVSYTLNIDMTWAGSPRDPFGSMMLTNVGSLGIREGFTVLAPYTRIPMVVTLCAMEKTPVVGEDGQLCVGQTMKLGFTVDHRIADGVHIARLLQSLRKYVAQPELLDSLASVDALTPAPRKHLNFETVSEIKQGGQYA